MANSIGDEINLATKSYHTTLNQLILHHLPFALPPNAPNHHLYALGISHFYPIYTTFESIFRASLRSQTLTPRTATLLKTLHLPALERAASLENDLQLLLPPSFRTPTIKDVPQLEAFKRHIQLSLAKKPHLLIAYTWIFYMALFSGGRYIRAKLRAGLLAQSMTLPASPRGDYPAGLSFWEFPGEQDGEDLKVEYKCCVAALSAHLSEEERTEVAEEGVRIMVVLTDVVREVADVVPARAELLAKEEQVVAAARDVAVFKGPVARIRSPWLLLVRAVFPFGLVEMLAAVLGFVAVRGRGGVGESVIGVRVEG